MCCLKPRECSPTTDPGLDKTTGRPGFAETQRRSLLGVTRLHRHLCLRFLGSLLRGAFYSRCKSITPKTPFPAWLGSSSGLSYSNRVYGKPSLSHITMTSKGATVYYNNLAKPNRNMFNLAVREGCQPYLFTRPQLVLREWRHLIHLQHTEKYRHFLSTPKMRANLRTLSTTNTTNLSRTTCSHAAQQT